MTILIDTDPALNQLPTQAFDDGDDISVINAPASAAASRDVNIDTGIASSTPFKDESEPVPHTRAKNELSMFMLALGLWCQEVGISRSQYRALLEILRIPEMKDNLHKLPSCLSTLKRYAIQQLPLLSLRKKSIPLTSEQLSRNKGKQVTQVQGKGRWKKQLTISTEDLYFFDPIRLFQTIASSDLTDKMHFGLAEYRDDPTELYHSRS